MLTTYLLGVLEALRTYWADPFVEVLMNRLWESPTGCEAANDYLADGRVMSILS